MRMTRSLLVVALLLLLPQGVRAQDRPGDSVTPAAAASPAQGADVMWYGKAPPGWGGVVGKMKLLAPGVGWAERAGRLYFTSDNGANWKDITPPLDTDERLESIFFLDPATGWMTINRPGLESELVSTTDAGATWTRKTIPVLPKDYGVSLPDGFFGSASTVAFVYSLHGWTNLSFAGETMNSRSGLLLVTSDGGRTWKHPADAPNLLQTEMLLVTPSEGWLYGADNDGGPHLFVTRDGARSWQEVAPDLPAVDESLVVGLPKFEDAKHGFLQVNGTQTKGDQFEYTMALMATSDGGRRWKIDRIVSHLDEESATQYGSPTVVGSDWIFAAASEHRPVLTKLGPGARIDASTDASESRQLYKVISQISFATPVQPWAVVGDGDLLSTNDGGATWTTLTPGPQPHVIQPHGSFVSRPAS